MGATGSPGAMGAAHMTLLCAGRRSPALSPPFSSHSAPFLLLLFGETSETRLFNRGGLWL